MADLPDRERKLLAYIAGFSYSKLPDIDYSDCIKNLICLGLIEKISESGPVEHYRLTNVCLESMGLERFTERKDE